MMRCCVRLCACLLFVAADAQIFESDCGTAVAQATPTIVNGGAAKYGTFPWHVGVYRQITRNKSYRYICAGTLVSSELVISAAHCFYDDTRGQLEDAREFRIAAGKYYRDYDSPNDPYVQKSSVKSIEIPERYIGLSGNWGADIALLRVEFPFTTNALVKPVCVHWNILDGLKHSLSGKIGKVVGWGLTETQMTSETLKEINLPIVPYKNCLASVPDDFDRFVAPPDKLCAGYLNGSSVCNGDSGGGLCVEHGGLWYLRGIVSAIPHGTTDLPCDNNQYAVFTNVDFFLEWIHSAFVGARIATNGCTLPNQPKNGSFKLTCRDKCDGVPGSIVPRGSILVHRCEKDHILEGNGVSTCGISGWSSLPICVKACPPLASSNGDIVCELGGQVVSCGSIMAPGTKGSLACPSFYKILATYNLTYDQITCLDEGKWDRPTPRCVPECGKMLDYEDLFRDTVDGTNQHAVLPWEVEIHYLGSGNAILGNIIYGTLIHRDLVLTAFHKNFFSDDNGKHRDPDYYEATAGRVRNLNTMKDFWQQKSKIVALNYVEPMEDGDELPRSRNVTMGLVLLRLATPFVMTIWVRPVCMDWDNRLVTEQLHEGSVGKVPMNLCRTNTTCIDGESDIDFTYLPREDCRLLLSDFYNYVFTSATFCGHTLPENSHPAPNVGRGISFKSDGLWYLRGPLSGDISSFRNTLNRNYAAFINVGNFLGWIHATYDDEGGCTLPKQPYGGKLELLSCREACDNEPWSRVPEGSVLVHLCNQGWRLEGREISTCSNNEWDSLPKCIKQCPTLVSPTVNVVCIYEGKRSPCGSHMAPGTTASLACRKFYKISDPWIPMNSKVTCLNGGEWDRPPLRCVPECGTMVDSTDLFRYTYEGRIQNAALPWAVKITRHGPSKENDPDSVLGTLIQPDLVLSVLDKRFFLDDEGQFRDYKDFRVYGGKFHNSDTMKYYSKEQSNIESIKTLETTDLQRGNHNPTGLVLVRQTKPFELSPWVRPICIDWDNRLEAKQLRNGNVGKAPRSLFATNETSVNGKGDIDFTYSPREDCLSLLRKEKQYLVGTVEFCGHTLFKPAHHSEDDPAVYFGHGVSFKSDGLWYLRGLASGLLRSDQLLRASNGTYLIFMNVGDFIEGIRNASVEINSTKL